MAKFLTILRVVLGANHRRPGRTRHAIVDVNGQQEFPPFVRLEIAQYPGDSSYYLLHICEDGKIADTNHETLEAAMHQAEWELGILQSDWEAVQPN